MHRVSEGLHQLSDVQRGRVAYRRRRAVRSVLLAAVSTGVLGVLLIVAVTGSPGWDRVKSSFLNWEIAKESFPAVLDGLVVDLPTAFYMTAAELDGGLIVGQLPQVGVPEQFGIVLDKDSPLTECVSEAVDQLRQDGTLAVLEKTWLAGTGGAPELQ